MKHDEMSQEERVERLRKELFPPPALPKRPAPVETKACTKCGETKPVTEFYPKRGKYMAHCKVCHGAITAAYRNKNREALNAWSRNRRQALKKEAAKSTATRCCSICGVEKLLREFPPSAAQCKTCIREKQRQYRQRNPERFKKYYRRYQKRHHERIRSMQRRWYQENKDLTIERSAARYAEKRDEILEQQRSYRRANRERIREYHRRYRQENSDKIIKRQRQWEQQNLERHRATRRDIRRRRRAREHGAEGAYTPDQLAARIAYYGYRCWICGAPYECIDHVKPLSAGGSNWPANLRPACNSCNQSKQGTWPFRPAA